jgi:hypothetical protein
VPERETIAGRDTCQLAEKWGVRPDIMQKAIRAADIYLMQTRSPVWIISGYRSSAEQQRLGKMGRPTAADEKSTHRTCPATGMDISLGSWVARDKKVYWGQVVELVGLRWGGGSPVDDHGIPSDWQHIDTGPRLYP